MNKTTTFYGAMIVGETAKAYKVRINQYDDCWLPKSQMSGLTFSEEDYNDGCMPVRFIDTLTVPTWLADKMPLIRKTGPVPMATKPW